MTKAFKKVKQNELHVYDVVLDQNQKRVLKRADKKRFPIITAVISLLIIVVLRFFSPTNLNKKHRETKQLNL